MPRALEGAPRCAECVRKSPGFERLVVLADYRRQPAIREWILAFKHGGRRDLALPLGTALARCAGPELRARGERVVLVPVPLHLARRIERGYDQAALLADEVGAATGIRVVRALRRQRPTAVQGEVGAVSRRANVRGAFAPRARWVTGLSRGRWAEFDRVWLVDDVVTSGATLRECARVLRRMGARRVSALAIARAARDPGEEEGQEWRGEGGGTEERGKE
ncbi:MAG: ComF family protein [Planctomycetes bacterium]|nr:ComF family protein [Planctomycetota bacterium]